MKNWLFLIVAVLFVASTSACGDAEEISKTIPIYDHNDILFSFSYNPETSNQVIIPGIPDGTHKEKSFLYYSTDISGNGKKYYPGEVLPTNYESLFANWENAVEQNAEIVNTVTFIQNFIKTDDRPKSYTMEGGTLITRNGRKYWIQAGVRNITENAKENHSVDKAMNYTAIFIFDYDSGELVNSAFNIPFGHGNDLEYNSQLDKIVICSAESDGIITEVDWSLNTYRQYSVKDATNYRIADCAYDSRNQKYYLTVLPENSNYLIDCVYILCYDQYWILQEKFDFPFKYPENHYGFQGAFINKDKLYLINFLKDNLQRDGRISYNYSRISIYDIKTMEYLGSIPINIVDEIEDITILDQTAYVNGQVYKDDEYYKFHVYEIDFGNIVFQ